MQVSPLIIAATTTTLISATALAKHESFAATTNSELHNSISGESKRSDSNDDRQQTSIPAIHRLVKKMLARRNTIDICDNGTGRCK